MKAKSLTLSTLLISSDSECFSVVLLCLITTHQTTVSKFPQYLCMKVIWISPREFSLKKKVKIATVRALHLFSMNDMFVAMIWIPFGAWQPEMKPPCVITLFFFLGASVTFMPPAAEKKTKNYYANVSTTQQAQTVGNARRTIRADLGVLAHIYPFPRAQQISVSIFVKLLVVIYLGALSSLTNKNNDASYTT